MAHQEPKPKETILVFHEDRLIMITITFLPSAKTFLREYLEQIYGPSKEMKDGLTWENGPLRMALAEGEGELGLAVVFIPEVKRADTKNKIRKLDIGRALQIAVDYGEIDLVKEAVARATKKDLNENAMTLLENAALDGKVEIFNYLFDQTDKDARNLTKLLPFAITGANVSIVKRVLKEGPRLNEPDSRGATCIHKAGAAFFSSPDLVRVLLQAGCKVNAIDDNGSSALHAAATANNYQIFQVLKDSGVNPDLVDKYGRTALMIAAENGSLRSVKMLLSMGANRLVKDQRGQTAADRIQEKIKIDRIQMSGRDSNEEILALLKEKR